LQIDCIFSNPARRYPPALRKPGIGPSETGAIALLIALFFPVFAPVPGPVIREIRNRAFSFAISIAFAQSARIGAL